MEIWKEVIGYEGIYEISNEGRIKSLKRNVILKRNKRYPERILTPIINKNGYQYFSLRKHGQKTKNALVHRLVCIAFLDNPLNKKCVNHKNFVKHDNRIENLEWVTHSENSSHCYKEGGRINTSEHKQTMGPRGANLVLNLETGIYYDSAREVVRTFNYDRRSFTEKLTGKSINNTSFVYA